MPADRPSSAPTASPVLVTGGAGFVGSHVVDRLLADGVEVVVVDDLSTGSRANLPSDARLEAIDVAGDGLIELVGSVRPTAIVHCAANASVVRATADPIHDARVNILGTINVVRAAATVGARVVYLTSGGALHGRPGPGPTAEDAAIDPSSPYGLSKWAAERYLDLLARDSAPAVLRLANVYGPRQRTDLEGGVVSIFIDRMRHGLPLEVHGDGGQTRDFVHVLDVADAVIRALGTPALLTVNIASGTATSIDELIAALARVSGRTPGVVRTAARPGDVRHSQLDPRRAAEILGWRPEIGLESGLDGLWRAAVALPLDETA